MPEQGPNDSGSTLIQTGKAALTFTEMAAFVRDIEARRQLLGLARLALEAAVIGAPAPKTAGAEVFDSRAGAFVTLEHTSQLRGCIGQLEPSRLGDLVVYCARAAALEDPRFARVSRAWPAPTAQRRRRDRIRACARACSAASAG